MRQASLFVPSVLGFVVHSLFQGLEAGPSVVDSLGLEMEPCCTSPSTTKLTAELAKRG